MNHQIDVLLSIGGYRPVTLTGLDGLIFVADSQKSCWERNKISWNELNGYFNERLIELPIVICFNKQHVTNKFNPVAFLKDIEYYKYKNIDACKTIAVNGEGILESFETLLKLILKDLYKREIEPLSD